MVEEFERDFAEFCDTKYCVGVSSGTDALRFALWPRELQPGDMVITVPHTFIATTEAISQAGAQPLFVDIDERPTRWTRRTAAIISKEVRSRSAPAEASSDARRNRR